MRIETTRFGTLTIEESELFYFPQGLIGLETLRQWALVPDPASSAVVWLQSASREEKALPMVSPRAFVEGYKVRVNQRSLAPLSLRSGDPTYILTAVSGLPGRTTINLRAPVLLNVARRLGCQVVTEDEHSLQYPLPVAQVRRKAA